MRKQSLRTLKKKAWKLLSLIVRQGAADANGYVTCYTCGQREHWTMMDAGHAIGGRHGAVLFDEDIIRPQNKRCNIFLRGNYPVFVAKLIREHSLEWWEKKLEDSTKLKKYTQSDLLEMIESYQSRLRVIEKSKLWVKAS